MPDQVAAQFHVNRQIRGKMIEFYIRRISLILSIMSCCSYLPTMSCQKKSGKNGCRISDIYFLDEKVHRNMYNHSPLCSIIINCIRTVARLVSGNTYFGFPHFSLIIEHYRVNVDGQKRTAIHPLDKVNITMLRSLQLSTDILDEE